MLQSPELKAWRTFTWPTLSCPEIAVAHWDLCDSEKPSFTEPQGKAAAAPLANQNPTKSRVRISLQSWYLIAVRSALEEDLCSGRKIPSVRNQRVAGAFYPYWHPDQPTPKLNFNLPAIRNDSTTAAKAHHKLTPRYHHRSTVSWRSPSEGAIMTDVAGLTSDGYIYTAEYFGAARDSILWAAVFRRNGKERGVRHGRVFGISQLSESDLRTAIKDDIEDTWIGGY